MASFELRIHGPHPTGSFINGLCLLAVSAIVSACGGGDDGIACTAEARTSVLLTVVDELNAPLPGVAVTYQVNGATAQSQACESNGRCAIAVEVSGVFSITASKAGYTSISGTATVTRDECHVNTERLTLTLRPAAQSSQARVVLRQSV
jgi:hypothetical protein